MQLIQSTVPERCVYTGEDHFHLSAGNTLKVEASGLPEGDILIETVPEGKSWAIKVRIEIVEDGT